MICKHCGTNVAEGTRFCPNCGAELIEEQSQYMASVPTPDPKPVAGNSTPVLVWGIIGLAFACTFYLSILGIIFSAIAKGKANDYMNTYGSLSRKASIGRKLAVAGLVVGIILSVLFLIFVVILANI